MIPRSLRTIDPHPELQTHEVFSPECPCCLAGDQHACPEHHHLYQPTKKEKGNDRKTDREQHGDLGAGLRD